MQNKQYHHPYRPVRNQRLGIELYSQKGRICHFTISTYNKQNSFVNIDLNNAIITLLCSERERLSCNIHVYCLMPDHLHLLCSPCKDGSSMLIFIDQFKGKSTRESWLYGCHGKLWQPRYYDHFIRKDEDLAGIAQYILHNPVRKGLCESPENYQWCGVMDPLPV